MIDTFKYKGYTVDIGETQTGYTYKIEKDSKLITESIQEFPFPNEAEVHSKLYIDRLIGVSNGWIIS